MVVNMVIYTCFLSVPFCARVRTRVRTRACPRCRQEGRHEIRVRAVDSAGNADPSPATYSWIVDRAGVYGHPSMVTDVVAEGGNKQVNQESVGDRGWPAPCRWLVLLPCMLLDRLGAAALVLCLGIRRCVQ